MIMRRSIFKVLALGCAAVALMTGCKKDPVQSGKVLLMQYQFDGNEDFSSYNKATFMYDYNKELSLQTVKKGLVSSTTIFDYGASSSGSKIIDVSHVTDPDDISSRTEWYHFQTGKKSEKYRMLWAWYFQKDNDNKLDIGFKYDKKGHLTEYSETLGEAKDVYYFVWSDGELVKAYSADESIVYEYTPSATVYAGALPVSAYPSFLPEPILAILGHYGTAPKHMPQTVKYTQYKENGKPSDKQEHTYTYTVNDKLLASYKDHVVTTVYLGDIGINNESDSYGKLNWVNTD